MNSESIIIGGACIGLAGALAKEGYKMMTTTPSGKRVPLGSNKLPKG